MKPEQHDKLIKDIIDKFHIDANYWRKLVNGCDRHALGISEASTYAARAEQMEYVVKTIEDMVDAARANAEPSGSKWQDGPVKEAGWYWCIDKISPDGMRLSHIVGGNSSWQYYGPVEAPFELPPPVVGREMSTKTIKALQAAIQAAKDWPENVSCTQNWYSDHSDHSDYGMNMYNSVPNSAEFG